MSALLETQSLTLTLPGRAARPLLADVNISVAAGEVVGLVGESGSGKSLTARTALGLLPQGAVVAGKTVVADLDVLKVSADELRALRQTKASMIFQDPRAGINPLRRIGDFLTEALRENLGYSKSHANARALELLEVVGLPDPARHLRQYPHELSGGMLQRVMIASAISTSPNLLLCDEPTTALDVTTQAEIVALLERIQAETGMGMLFITHDLDLAAAICDRIYVMYAGRIVEEQPSQKLFERPLHPYTAGLLASTPGIEADERRLVPITGTPLSLAENPDGCAFANRCPHAIVEVCGLELPPLAQVASGAWLRCARPEVLATTSHRVAEADHG